jgi:release factor glutamine methyltransferase
MAVSVAELLDDATARIAAAVTLDKRDARLDARVLATHVLQVNAAWLIAHDTDSVAAAARSAFESLLSRRLAGAPVAYLVGVREFYGRRFRVTPDVLIPRPETELLVEQALLHLPDGAPHRVLDLGTGSGCVAITLALERPHAEVTATDCSAAALSVARQNADSLNARLHFLPGSWFDPVAHQDFDLIVSNPPYVAALDPHLHQGDVRFEPRTALAAGEDGLNDLRHIIRLAAAHLAADGWLWLEHGYDQGDVTQTLLHEAGFTAIQTRLDTAALPRVSGGKVSK